MVPAAQISSPSSWTRGIITISEKTGIDYPDFESGNEFWNRVQVPGSCYKSLSETARTAANMSAMLTTLFSPKIITISVDNQQT